MTIKTRGNIYSINEGYASLWDKATQEYINNKKYPKNGKPYGKRFLYFKSIFDSLKILSNK